MSELLFPFETGTIDDCAMPTTLALRDYWNEMYVAAGTVPRYCDVDLMNLFKIADSLFVKDVINDGEDFFNRYWGSSLTEAVGFDTTGTNVSSYEPAERRERLMVRYRKMLVDWQPVSRRAEIKHLHQKQYVTYEVLHVPFLDPKGEKVEQIMAAYEFSIPLDC